MTTVSADRSPSPGKLTHRQILLVFSGLMAGLLLAALDQTIVATALPTMVGELGGLDHYSWVVTAYLICVTVGTPLYGKISDVYGRRIVFQTAIAIFLAGSLAAGLAQSMLQLIVFRGVQGIGAGGLITMSFAIVADVVSPRERGRYTGYLGSVFALASIIALCAWGLTCMFQSLGPSIVIRLLDVQNRAAATVLVACFLGSSSIVQIRLRHWPTRRATLLGLALLPVGGLLVTLSVVEQSLTAFVAGSVIGGVGQGLAYLGGQSLVESVAPASIRGEVFSTYLIVVYLSGGVPAVLLGLVAKATGLYSSTVGYTILIAALALSVLALCARLLGREPVRLPDEPPPVAV